MKKGYSLLELIIVISIIGIFFAFVSINFGNFETKAEFKAITKTIVSDLRLCQQNAISQKESCDTIFEKDYYIINNKKKHLPSLINIKNPKTIRFSSSGNPQPGYFGTIILESKNQSIKIIVSAIGRIRVE
ncbi:hypothetical protein A2230_04625 [candidate division WOR-1 bacterium RIFOXYA2_FULL_36_21]|uniref:General secretion pathway GspH domain-containing protein n=1 Tax=candidate division WOR-1 bacterium RIFOXYB2_FULL_36_35 TaxID=1802578 RepID=A0A1F4S2N9_UNCSA|nr:MAG: hypothetical protein A2230_04625 [candidate division WOR-1 bacterium RIFOXYA2_FULL_36_21]OGC14678.1 MAG: hypothetical protein A2290_01355 [candidate division WOR-1 bacterium RIFOXYB2_FULL_36_35]OGC19696.1 MAG: hypothetical protein A2282_03080 [candidate division WOR-1 bacterium RIFOXYA12_FULL_36_13]